MRNGFDYYKNIEKPNMYLCNPDRTPIGCVHAENRHLVLRFNDLSELTFTVHKIEGTESIYERIETKRLLFIEKIGWFQITDVSSTISGASETKEVTAESHQTQLKTRGFISEERVYMFYNPNDPMDKRYDSSDVGAMPSVVGQLYQQIGMEIDLQDEDVEATKDYGNWTLTYIDPSLKFTSKSYDKMYESKNGADNVCRSFSENETFGYDFIVNDVESAFEVVFEFDFLYHTIKVKRLKDITLPTNIYLSFDNVVETIGVTENSENIITVLSCNGNDLDIRTVNPMGTNYIVNFDYYKGKADRDGKVRYLWMSEDLAKALDAWEEEWRSWQKHDDNRFGHKESYSELVEAIQEKYAEQAELSGELKYAELKCLDLKNARDQKFDDEKGIVSVEDVSAGEKSLCPTSSYYRTAFNENAEITAYVEAPTASDDYEFTFAGTSEEGTAKSMLLNFTGETKGDDGYYDIDESSEGVCLYFTDDSDKKSYCKILVAAEVGVVKDASGNIGKEGHVEVRGKTFSVTSSGDESIVKNDSGYEVASGLKSNTYFIYDGVRYKIVKSADGIVTIYCFYVSGFRKFTTYNRLGNEDNWCDIWEQRANAIKKQIDSDLAKEIDSIREKMEYISDRCHIQKYIKGRGDKLYNEFLNYWVEGEYSNDNLASSDSTTIAERISLAKELMSAGETELEKVSQPTFELSVSALNFIKLFEFKPFTDELELGRVITIERDAYTRYRPALVSIEYDLDSVENFSMEFSTAAKLDETAMTFADLLNQSSSTSRTISSNWSNLTDYSRNKENIEELTSKPLDASLRAGTGKTTNQEFAIDETGILGRSKKDADNFADEQLRIVNNSIKFTDDNWNSVKTALGKIKYDIGDGEEEAYGLVADVLVGSLLFGKNLKIKNERNTISLDEKGIIINDGRDDVFKAGSSGDVLLKGEVRANKGSIGAFEITDDGLESQYIILDSYELYLPKQSQLNLNNEVLMYYLEEDSVTKAPTTYIKTNGAKNFEIKNNSGAGLRFMANKEAQEIKATLKIECLNVVKDTTRVSTTWGMSYRHSMTLKAYYEITDSTDARVGMIEGYRAEFYVKYADINNNSCYAKCSYQIPAGQSSGGFSFVFYTWDGSTENDARGGYDTSSIISWTENGSYGSLLSKSVISIDGDNTMVYSLGSFFPDNEKCLLGDTDHKWGSIAAETSAITTSDERFKNSISKLTEKYESFFDLITPVSYKFNNGTSNRFHTGFIAQDVETALYGAGLTTQDFAGLCISDTSYSLRYEEFIALNTDQIQKLKSRVKALEKAIKELKGE